MKIEWNRVESKIKPKDREYVLIFDELSEFYCWEEAYYDKEHNHFCNTDGDFYGEPIYNISHWARVPLPKQLIRSKDKK